MVHVIEHRLDDGSERVVADRATEASMFLEIILGETAILASDRITRCTLGVQRGFKQQVSERKTTRVRHSLGLRARLTQVHLVHLVVDDLSQVNGGGLGA